MFSDRASAFIPLRYTANLQYEGTTSGMITSEAWNEYYLTGYHGELKSYKYSDKGTLGADGNGNFDYRTIIQYTSNMKTYLRTAYKRRYSQQPVNTVQQHNGTI